MIEVVPDLEVTARETAEVSVEHDRIFSCHFTQRSAAALQRSELRVHS